MKKEKKKKGIEGEKRKETNNKKQVVEIYVIKEEFVSSVCRILFLSLIFVSFEICAQFAFFGEIEWNIQSIIELLSIHKNYK